MTPTLTSRHVTSKVTLSHFKYDANIYDVIALINLTCIAFAESTIDRCKNSKAFFREAEPDTFSEDNNRYYPYDL